MAENIETFVFTDGSDNYYVIPFHVVERGMVPEEHKQAARALVGEEVTPFESRSKWEQITLERGVTNDPTFAAWISNTWSIPLDRGVTTDTGFASWQRKP